MEKKETANNYELNRKETYLRPTFEVIELECESPILAGSRISGNTNTDFEEGGIYEDERY